MLWVWSMGFFWSCLILILILLIALHDVIYLTWLVPLHVLHLQRVKTNLLATHVTATVCLDHFEYSDVFEHPPPRLASRRPISSDMIIYQHNCSGERTGRRLLWSTNRQSGFNVRLHTFLCLTVAGPVACEPAQMESCHIVDSSRGGGCSKTSAYLKWSKQTVAVTSVANKFVFTRWKCLHLQMNYLLLSAYTSAIN